MLEDEIIRQIIDTWSLAQARLDGGRRHSPIPSFDHVKILVETAFLASLKREEDRPLHFALVLADPNTYIQDGNAAQIQTSLLHLNRPRPFSVDSIGKLAPALDPTLSGMAVGPTTAEGDLQIWGVFKYHPLSHRFNDVPIVLMEELAHHPDLLTVYAKRPGSLIIGRSHFQVGRVFDGRFSAATPTPFSSHSLGQYMINAIQNDPIYRQHEDIYWQAYRDAVDCLLSEAAARGHGSTIVFLDPDSARLDYCASSYVPRFELVERIGLRRLLSNELHESRDIGEGIARRKLIMERIQLFAQMAALDGALILTTGFDLVGFGATLSAPPWSKSTITGPDGSGQGGGQTFDPLPLGTRHNSAIAFAGACDGSFVFVISQDGPVRAFVRRDENTVLCWPDCGVSVFL